MADSRDIEVDCSKLQEPVKINPIKPCLYETPCGLCIISQSQCSKNSSNCNII